MNSGSTILLLGFGRFGRALAELAHDAGLGVRALDPGVAVPDPWRVDEPAQLLAQPGLVVPAVPMARFRGVLEAIRPLCGPQHTLVDVGSVKSGARAALDEICGAAIPWVCAHPLFGPMSVALGERPLRVVLCTDTPHAQALARTRRAFEQLGCTVFEQTSEEHDRKMARTHALAFFVAKGMLELGVGEEQIVPPSFRAMAATIDSVRADAGHLFYPIQHQNPFAPGAREQLLDALGRIHRELAEADARPAADDAALEFAIAPPARMPVELGQARAGIDALDEELLELLARRAQLALRAARAKAEQGRAVQDPGREQELLEKRSELARRHGLDGQSVTDVFEAILRFSRAEQRRWLEARENTQQD